MKKISYLLNDKYLDLIENKDIAISELSRISQDGLRALEYLPDAAVIAVLTYSLPMIPSRDARCFYSSESSYLAAEYIKTEYAKGGNSEEAIANAQRAFEEIRDLNPTQVLLVRLGCSAAQVIDATCVHLCPLESLEYIRERYNKGDDNEEKRANAQRAFEEIQYFTNESQILALRLGLSHTQIRAAPCLESYASSSEVIKYIMQEFRKGGNLEERQANAQKAFAEFQAQDVISELEEAKAFDWGPIRWGKTIPVVKAIYYKIQKESSITGKSSSVNKSEVKARLKECMTEIFTQNHALAVPDAIHLIRGFRPIESDARSIKAQIQDKAAETTGFVAREAARRGPKEEEKGEGGREEKELQSQRRFRSGSRG